MTSAAKDNKQPRPLPAPNSDFYKFAESLPAEELAIVKKVRAYMETKVQPIINKYWVEDSFPFELLPSFKELGIAGLGMGGYGRPGGSRLLGGPVAMEIARTDASWATLFGVHSGLAMNSIYLNGTEGQRQKWLPPMAREEKIGCFALTEPPVGSLAGGGLLTTAKREGDTWVLNGQKRWIGNAPWCDISSVWARNLENNGAPIQRFCHDSYPLPGPGRTILPGMDGALVRREAPDFSGAARACREHCRGVKPTRVELSRPVQQLFCQTGDVERGKLYRENRSC